MRVATTDLWVRRQLLAVHIELNAGSRGADRLLEAVKSILEVDRLDVAVLRRRLGMVPVLRRALSPRATELIGQAPLLLGRFARHVLDQRNLACAASLLHLR